MGAYIYITENDRIDMRKVADTDLDTEFQEALKYDPSLMISEYTRLVRKGLFKKDYVKSYSIYHESPAFDGSTYQARLQGSACGTKEIVITYLHGIINGCLHNGIIK